MVFDIVCDEGDDFLDAEEWGVGEARCEVLG